MVKQGPIDNEEFEALAFGNPLKQFVQTIHVIMSFDDYKDLLKCEKPVLLEFKAKWCHSSNMLQPHCKIFSEKYINLKFASIDV